MLKNCQSANIYTIEALTEASEPAIQRIGMGARALKTKAEAWMSEAKTKGVVAEELSAMQVQLEAMTERLNEAEASNLALRSELGDPPRVRGKRGG
jgi:hypothetical protein